MDSLVCSDFDAFAEALPDLDGRYLLAGRAACDWQLHAFDLEGVTLMCGRDGAANLFQAACHRDVGCLFVPLHAPSGLTVNGVAMDAATVAWLAPGSDFLMRAPAANAWIALMIERRALPRAFRETRVARARAVAVDALRAQVRRARFVPPSGPADARALREALLATALGVLESMPGAGPVRGGRPALPRRAIVGTAIEVIEGRLDEALHLNALCRATGVSGRTLQTAFVEQLGTSPYQYIVSRRMQRIHEALREASVEDTVSGICGRFGVWDFGRFAQTFQRRFGVAPSEVLAAHRPDGAEACAA